MKASAAGNWVFKGVAGRLLTYRIIRELKKLTMKTTGKVVLVILDGWGFRQEKKGNAIAQAFTPHYSKMLGTYPNGLIQASSHYVGLPDGVMGNSEVGHMNIGAGRLIMQDQVRINAAIADESFYSYPMLKEIAAKAKASSARIHLMGLVSKGNVHSSEAHYLALLYFFAKEGVPGDKILFHAILDGRDTAPQSGQEYLATLEAAVKQAGGKIATVSGRFYAMDRDTRWERTDLAYQAIALGVGKKETSPMKALQKSYELGETDEFVTPWVMTDEAQVPIGKMRKDDMVLCFNFRADRMRQICRALLYPETPVPSVDKDLQVQIFSFTQYDATFPVPTIFSPYTFENCLGELMEQHHLHQFRTAETEKYAHVTFFFNCGREKPFANEDRSLIPSPKVKTYDTVPEMNSAIVTKGVVEKMKSESHDLIVVNYAQPDMVGHTGNFDAALAAVEATDRAIGDICEAAMDHGYAVIITADHGNIEMMIDPMTGGPHTAHTLNPVPVVCVGDGLKRYRIRPKGSLSDLAPTVLRLMNIEKPKQMTGESLIIST